MRVIFSTIINVCPLAGLAPQLVSDSNSGTLSGFVSLILFLFLRLNSILPLASRAMAAFNLSFKLSYIYYIFYYFTTHQEEHFVLGGDISRGLRVIVPDMGKRYW